MNASKCSSSHLGSQAITFHSVRSATTKMNWYQEDVYEDEEEDLLFSPALLARRASESWIVAPPVEVHIKIVKSHFYK